MEAQTSQKEQIATQLTYRERNGKAEQPESGCKNVCEKNADV